jgi:hypothetical protein
MYIDSILYTIYKYIYIMNNSRNPQNDYAYDNILETLMRAYLNNTPSTPATPPSARQPAANSYELYSSIILALRDIISGYNAQTRSILDILRAIRQDISTTNNIPIPRQAPIGSNRRHYARNATTGLPTSAPGNSQLPVRLFNIDLFSSIYNTPTNLEDVAVRPTVQQLAAALETITYVPSELTSSRCPITLEDFVQGDVITRIRPCGHIFHTQSIRNWFNNRVRCPVCRCDIREYVEEAAVDISSNTSPNSSENPNIEQAMQGLTSAISDMITNYFANNIDLSMNQVFRFDIPIVTTTTYEDHDDEDNEQNE